MAEAAVKPVTDVQAGWSRLSQLSYQLVFDPNNTELLERYAERGLHFACLLPEQDPISCIYALYPPEQHIFIPNPGHSQRILQQDYPIIDRVFAFLPAPSAREARLFPQFFVGIDVDHIAQMGTAIGLEILGEILQYEKTTASQYALPTWNPHAPDHLKQYTDQAGLYHSQNTAEEKRRILERRTEALIKLMEVLQSRQLAY